MSTDAHLALIQRLAELAEPGRTRWPEFAARLDRARTEVERELGTGEPAAAAVAVLASFDHEDDGTANGSTPPS